MDKKFEHGHCPLCGSPLDSEGICTKVTCRRRKIQLRIKELREAAKDEGKDKGAKAP